MYSCLKHFLKTHLPMRLFIFCITSMCAGLPALIWAFTVLCNHHISKNRISFIAIFLLLSDLLDLILNSIPICIATLIKLNSKIVELFMRSAAPYFSSEVFFTLLFAARLCGYLFHLLVILEFMLTQKYPLLAFLFSAPRSITLSIVVLVVIIGSQFIPLGISNQINVLFLVLPLFMYAITYVMTYKTSPDTNLTTREKPRVLILTVSMFTVIVLYLPFFLSCYVSNPFTLDILVYMRVISEPLLCVLICRQNHFVAKQ